MRHIHKTERCQDFDNYVTENNLDEYLDNYINNSSISPHPWMKLTNEFSGREAKRKLATHLYREQKGLCIYCQQNLSYAFDNQFKTNTSHIEHIKPKARHRYPQDTFNQNNLTLSCNGFECILELGSYEFCGHNKQERYNHQTFLNPIELEDIERYFEYTFEGDINPSKVLDEIEKQKANEMINILDLKNSRLIDMRQRVFSEMINNTEEDINLLLDENADLLPSFYSMMKQLLQ